MYSISVSSQQHSFKHPRLYYREMRIFYILAVVPLLSLGASIKEEGEEQETARQFIIKEEGEEQETARQFTIPQLPQIPEIPQLRQLGQLVNCE